MSLSLDEVRRIARLAYLRLTSAEEATFPGQLAEIVAYIDRLRRREGERPSMRPTREATEGAADLVEPCLPQEAFLANAPAVRDGFLVVPRVMAEGDDDG